MNASDAPEKAESEVTALLALGPLYMLGGQPWDVVEHLGDLVSILGECLGALYSLVHDSDHPIE